MRFGLKSHQDYEHGCPLTPINIDRPFKPRILIFSTSLSEDTSELVMMSFRTENLDISSQLLDWCGRSLATMLRPDREQLSAVSENLSAPALSSARARQHSVCFFVRLRDSIWAGRADEEAECFNHPITWCGRPLPSNSMNFQNSLSIFE